MNKHLTFIARYIVIGLALAFLIVLLKPELLDGLRGQSSSQYFDGFSAAVHKSAPAVANIYTVRVSVQQGLLPTPKDEIDLGSAVIIDQEGYVVTSYHLVRQAEQIFVQLANGKVAEPRWIGADAETDLALLKIDGVDLPSITMGRSDQLEIGDIVLAIGNPYGLSQTVTQGIVSATGRGLLGLTNFENFIQTDAAINQGNSGGALVNVRGELVGINAATLAQDHSTEGISFAIPVNLVRGVVRDLKEHGRVVRGWLGLTPSEFSLAADDFERLGIVSQSGIYLENVYVNGPGWMAGLRDGDVITHLNSVAVESRQQALLLVASLKPGATVEIDGYSRNRKFHYTAIAGERPMLPE
ncbi:MAG: trypsin-like peptidase domain-containing protein [Pseudomonadota bacterium]